MPKFPTSEAEVTALAETMVAGYTAHALDFPSVTVADLQTALDTYQTDRQSQANAKAQAQIATEAKTTKLGDLVAVMKNDLKLSEVDVAADPEKLTQIGWGPKAQPTPIEAPGAPTELTPSFEGAGTLQLKWDKPATGSGGAVRNYLIQRRDHDETGQFGNWQLLDFAYDTEMTLTDQPRSVQMEYRVKASNAAGESLPSNTTPVVL
ncbi:MAG: fibronectin type III domain-containing protein [Planctomycetes bacterium]|nr:fibronectin type III domain-containing protein [Planctomycetota bacterium]